MKMIAVFENYLRHKFKALCFWNDNNLIDKFKIKNRIFIIK